MKRIIVILIILSVFTGCTSIKCAFDAKRAVKLQKRSIERIDKMISRGCDIDIDSTLTSKTVSIDTVEVIKDRQVIVEVPSDALIWEQTLRCDSLGNVVLDMEQRLLRKPKTIKGDVRLVDNVIIIECKYDSLQETINIMDTTINYLNTKIETLNNNVVITKAAKGKWYDGIIWIIALIISSVVAYLIFIKIKK
tara:strand:+ start:54 stop:635 length:582 start_codon:yes stop_codon:yes gene_type:complete